MRDEAVGLIEVYGLATAFAAVDAACKAADVTVEALDKNKPAGGDLLPVPLLVLVKIRGGTAEVKCAVEAGLARANELGGAVISHVIARPADDTEKMLSLSAL